MALVRYTHRIMTNAETVKARPAEKETTQAKLREVAHDMEVALYRRYSEGEAAEILGISESELADLRKQERIAYLSISEKAVGFFGYQVLTYLLECIVEPSANKQTAQATAESKAQPTISADAELISVDDTLALMGIGRTKLYELLNANEIESVKIGRRTLIRRASLRQFTDPQER